MSKQYPELKKAWYQKNKDRLRAKSLQYYHEHKHETWPKTRERKKLYSRQYKKQLRNRLLESLGSQCVRCGFDDPRALQFDHINGGGTKEMNKKFNRNNKQKYKYYLDNPEEAKTKLQILCANCNWIKRFENNEHNSWEGEK